MEGISTSLAQKSTHAHAHSLALPPNHPPSRGEGARRTGLGSRGLGGGAQRRGVGSGAVVGVRASATHTEDATHPMAIQT